MPRRRRRQPMDELLDIVNDADSVTGQAMRSIVHQQGLLHRGVHVFLFNERGEMLIQKRSADRANSPSLWDCSVSEHVKGGENYLDAAIRGLKEELGVEGISIERIGKIQMEYGLNDHEISEIYEGRLNGKQVRFDPGEISEVKFIGMDAIRTGIVDEKEKYCYWFIELMNWHFGFPGNLKVVLR